MHFFHGLKFTEIGSLFFLETFLIREKFTEKVMTEGAVGVIIIWR